MFKDLGKKNAINFLQDVGQWPKKNNSGKKLTNILFNKLKKNTVKKFFRHDFFKYKFWTNIEKISLYFFLTIYIWKYWFFYSLQVKNKKKK